MKIYKLGEIADINRESIGKSNPFSKIIYLDTSSITENIISHTAVMNLCDAPSRAQRKVMNNTIIYSTVRPRLKHYGILSYPPSSFIVSTGFVTIDVKEQYKDKVDSRYLYLLLTQPTITEYIGNIADTAVSAYPSINPSDISSLTFKLPDIKKQKRIADVWYSFDRKIAINRAINQNLEAMAKQLYDYWFVQFDFPDEEGKPYKASGGKMVWNEKLKREIPLGWKVEALGSISAKYQQGIIRSNNELSDDKKYAYLKMGNLDGNGSYSVLNISRTNAVSNEVETYSLNRGDFLINVRNSYEIVGKTCVIDYTEANTLFNHMLVRISFNKVSSYYMNILFNSEHMKKRLDGMKQGTTTVIALYQDDLNRLPILIPSSETMNLFVTQTESILSYKSNLVGEVIALTKQRDELLPLLMNGQVTVNSDLSYD